jgi:hypothetical protein
MTGHLKQHRAALALLVTGVLLAAAPTASAQTLSERRAERVAEDVAGFVYAFIEERRDYDVRGFGVRSCDRRDVDTVHCGLWWAVLNVRTRRAYWCTTKLVVTLEDGTAEEPDWDYGAVRCPRRRARARTRL